MKRKLTTIFCADVAGYSRMMGFNEARTLATLKEYRAAIEGFIDRHHGRVVSWSGDGLLADFDSVVEAVQCGAEVQRELQARNGSKDEDTRMTFRIGINLGDVMIDGDDIFGEGVNIAARLQQMAVPGGILISSPVYDQVRGKLSMGFAPLGAQQVKNIAGEVAIYSITLDGVTPQSTIGQNPTTRAPDPQNTVSMLPAPVKRGKLFRRGLALVTDYLIVAVVCVIGAFMLNTMVAATTVRMDLDIPFVDYGDRVDATPWQVVKTGGEDNYTYVTEQRNVTYDYLGLFTQTYRQERTSGEVKGKDRKAKAGPEAEEARAAAQQAREEAQREAQQAREEAQREAQEAREQAQRDREQAQRDREEAQRQRDEAQRQREESGATPTPEPAPEPVPEPAPAAPPAPPAPPPPAPAPPAPPAPPSPPKVEVPGVTVDGENVEAPGVSVKDGTVTIGGGAIVVGPDGVQVGRQGDDEDDGDWFQFSFGDDETFNGKFRHHEERLIDAATGNPITRPSLDTLSLVLLALYFAVMEAGRVGTTIGKRAFDLAVTREDGRSLSFANALGRNAIKVLTFFIFPIAIIVALVSRRRQGIHDRIARTVVVHYDA